MDTVRVFTRWLASIDALELDLLTKVRAPSLSPEENTRGVALERDDAEAILEYLERYEYASLPHVVLALLWHTMLRTGSARALDVEDYSPEEQCLAVRHRPETGTPIKNGERGERLVALSGRVCNLLEDWLRDRRPDVTDEHGREPLLATSYGRAAISTIRKYCYRYSRPCAISEECPHDRKIEDCDAATDVDEVSKCPSAISPHAIRRGSITRHLADDVPETAVGDRANVTQEVLEQHYDQRSEREKMEQRRQYVDGI